MSIVIQPKTKNSWELTKAINLGDVVSIGVALVVSLSFIFQIDKKVDTQEIKIKAIENQMSLQREDTQRMFVEVKESMHRIDAKLDRLIERQGG